MFVIPKEGLTVRDPITKRALPATGREVGESFYWHRRLRDGDITLGTPPAASAAKKPAEAAKQSKPAEE
jgi:hypothetical protein